MKKLIVWGATGQSIVLEEFLSEEYDILAIFDNNKKVKSPFENVPIYYGWDGFKEWKKNNIETDVYFIVAISGANGIDRVEVSRIIKKEGLKPIFAIHPTSYIAASAKVSEECQILPNVTIGARAFIGQNTIVNTSASIDHECVLGEGVHIGPGAKLAGCVEVGDYSFIGTNATILPRIKIGKNSIIGAGAVVTKDVPDDVIAYGNPCQVINKL